MGDYKRSQDVSAPADQLFSFLSEVGNLPRYFTAMTSAEPAEGDAVRMTADVNGTTEKGEAWFRVDRERRHLEWGSQGPNDYHGYLDVAGDGGTSSVTVFLHTERHDSGEIDQGIAETLATVKRLVERGPGPSPAGSGDQLGAGAEGGTAGRVIPPAVCILSPVGTTPPTVSHDHEGFCTLCGTKSFVIMKDRIHERTIGIVFIVVIVVLGLALWLAMVARAARRPAQEHRQHDPMHGLVQSGQHVGGGLSVAPHPYRKVARTR